MDQAKMKDLMLQLLKANELPEPDEIVDGYDGSIVCLWHGPRVAVVVDPSPNLADDVVEALVAAAVAQPVRDDRNLEI